MTPRKLPCAHCGADHAVPFIEIDFENEPAMVPIEVIRDDDQAVIIDQGVNPLHYATPEEYPPGKRYGKPAACEECGHVSMPHIKDEDVKASPAIRRSYIPAVGIIAGEEK